MDKDKTKLTSNHKLMLRRRGLDPKHYIFVKETYGSVYFRDTRDGSTKIVNKCN